MHVASCRTQWQLPSCIELVGDAVIVGLCDAVTDGVTDDVGEFGGVLLDVAEGLGVMDKDLLIDDVREMDSEVEEETDNEFEYDLDGLVVTEMDHDSYSVMMAKEKYPWRPSA